MTMNDDMRGKVARGSAEMITGCAFSKPWGVRPFDMEKFRCSFKLAFSRS